MAHPQTPMALAPPVERMMFDGYAERPPDLPEIADDEQFSSIVSKLSSCIIDAIDGPHTFEQMRTSHEGRELRLLVSHLSANVRHPAIVNAILALKWHFASLEPDDRGLNQTRGHACEIVAWRFLAHLSESDIINYLLYELPGPSANSDEPRDVENGHSVLHESSLPEVHEGTPLIPSPHISVYQRHNRSKSSLSHTFQARVERTLSSSLEEDPMAIFIGLNGLEVAAVADAKSFLGQRKVQEVLNGIWKGDIVFWETLSRNSRKKAHFYNKRKADPYCRLRVPKYQKVFEALFFASFLALYYAVLVERNPRHVTPTEILLYIWIAAFAYDELSEFRDAGTLFYSTDFWSSWDLGIIGIGVAFFVARLIGLIKMDDNIIDTAFDILSLEALFLVPRICSLLSLHPYFGTLIPCLREMTKDFVKFLGVVVILYLAREKFTPSEMSWILIKVFFGSSYLGFDVMREISPYLGPPVMLVFVCLTQILLVTSLISLLSNSLTKVMDHAREEYLFIFSVYILEASTSNRLTYFYPPLNLLPLVFLRPLRLFVPAEKLRHARIVLLKVTHCGYLGAIMAFETVSNRLAPKSDGNKAGTWAEETMDSRQSRDHASSQRRRPALDGRASLSKTGQEGHQEPNAHAKGRHGRKGKEAEKNEERGKADASELHELIARLSQQVDELRDVVAEQRRRL
ncbi:MAG: hypothetical protein M1824_004510 [Vezdaea acicularis]|nr:MAG: hypothetical protein M1824_004510 [Vezdaea acicularis]